MLSLIRRSTARSFIAALLIACLFSLAAPIAAAADGPHDANKSAGREDSSSADAASAPSEAKTLRCCMSHLRLRPALRSNLPRSQRPDRAASPNSLHL